MIQPNTAHERKEFVKDNSREKDNYLTFFWVILEIFLI